MFFRNRSAKPQTTQVLHERFGVRIERAEWQGQDVLVKTLCTDDSAVAARFKREGEISARIGTHPNIVPLLSSSPTQLIYRFMLGGDLRVIFNQGVLELPDAFALMRGLLAAVGHAHGRGITHLDLKPENILLENGRVRVTDFGLSHDRLLPRITQLGDRSGTPHYMAPEQFAGIRYDPRSDLYSCGVILFEALSGEHPYPDPFRWLAGMPAERTPLPFPLELHPLLESALSRDPEDRPASALAFLMQLERLADEL